MAAIASVLVVLWPGLLGAVITGLLIYLSLRGTGSSGLQWRAEHDEPTGQETGTANRPRWG